MTHVICRFPDGEIVAGVVISETTIEIGATVEYPDRGSVYEYAEVPAYRISTASGEMTVTADICEEVS